MTALSYAEAKWVVGTDADFSNELDLRSHRIVGLVMPATWTAAKITFQGAALPANQRASTAGVEPLQDVFDSGGTEVQLTVTQGHFVVLTEAHRQALGALARVKLRSGVTGTPVDQAADRLVTVVLEVRESNT